MFFYLAGSIEYSPDFGKGWRAEIKPALTALGHEVYDPAEDEMKNLTETEAREFRTWKATDLPRFRRTIQKIIAYDLDLIEQRCDGIICYWDEHAGRGAGTQGELTLAHRRGIPVYLICGVPVEQMSGWLLGCASEIFSSVGDFHAFMSNDHGRRDPSGMVTTRGKARAEHASPEKGSQERQGSHGS